MGKNCARGLEYRTSRRLRAVLKTEGTVFLNTDRPRLVNNIFIYLFFNNEILPQRTRMI